MVVQGEVGRAGEAEADHLSGLPVGEGHGRFCALGQLAEHGGAVCAVCRLLLLLLPLGWLSRRGSSSSSSSGSGRGSGGSPSASTTSRLSSGGLRGVLLLWDLGLEAYAAHVEVVGKTHAVHLGPVRSICRPGAWGRALIIGRVIIEAIWQARIVGGAAIHVPCLRQSGPG